MLSDYSNAIPLIAFLLVFIIIIVIVKSIGELINKITKQLALGLISRLLGAIFGMIKLLIICIFLLLLATDYELIDRQTQEKSILLIPLQRFSKIIIPEINKHKKIIIEVTKESTEKAKQTLEQKINPE
jgi:membrane protein required for colicin V production